VRPGANLPTQSATAVSVPFSGTCKDIDLKLLESTVLIVDDSPLNRKYLRRSLLSISPAVNLIEFDDGVPAVKCIRDLMLQAPMPDTIVFMDNIMIEMHGPAAAKEMRSIGFRGTIIAVTGNLVKEDVDLFLNAGADRLVGKPFAKPMIEDVLRDHVQSIAAKVYEMIS